ncbi:MAG: hypothetical protein WCS55_04660 [Sulfuricurvum sp.]|uniref:hypothetical protein n=1 Tax=Sulfuricurvum sp. TaxID=2025608 RepID=UPI00356A490E
MTEAVAKTKICPYMAKPLSVQLETDNWDFCRGSECMAWEWMYLYQTYNGKHTNEEWEDSGKKNTEIPIKWREGYCNRK